MLSPYPGSYLWRRLKYFVPDWPEQCISLLTMWLKHFCRAALKGTSMGKCIVASPIVAPRSAYLSWPLNETSSIPAPSTVRVFLHYGQIEYRSITKDREPAANSSLLPTKLIFISQLKYISLMICSLVRLSPWPASSWLDDSSLIKQSTESNRCHRGHGAVGSSQE